LQCSIGEYVHWNREVKENFVRCTKNYCDAAYLSDSGRFTAFFQGQRRPVGCGKPRRRRLAPLFGTGMEPDRLYRLMTDIRFSGP
jgi:hypothetical protein